MSEVHWHKKDKSTFSSKVYLEDIDQFNDFIQNYQSYLINWKGLSHPSLLELRRFELVPSQSEKIITCHISVQQVYIEHYCFEASFLTSKHLIEKLFILYQTIDLAKYLNDKRINIQFWDIRNLLHHTSNNCKWLPLPPGLWVEKNNYTFPAALAYFAFSLFEIPIPNTTHEWSELERKLFFPHEWTLFFQECLNNSQFFDNSHDQLQKIAKFILFQSWIYTNSVNLCMRDKALTHDEDTLLQRLRALLKINDNQSDILDIFSLTPKDKWDDFFSLILKYF